MLQNGVEIKQKIHEFHLQTPQGVQVLKVLHSQMKRCGRCECDRFSKQYYVTWAKPTNLINAPPICLNVEIYVCANCQTVVSIDSPTNGDSFKGNDGLMG